MKKTAKPVKKVMIQVKKPKQIKADPLKAKLRKLAIA
jgi:hypothetical protein